MRLEDFLEAGRSSVDPLQIIDDFLSEHLPRLGFDPARKKKWVPNAVLYPERRGLYLIINVVSLSPEGSGTVLGTQFGRRWPSPPNTNILSGRLEDYCSAEAARPIARTVPFADREVEARRFAEDVIAILPDVLENLTLDQLISIEKRRYPNFYSPEAVSDGMKWPDIDL